MKSRWVKCSRGKARRAAEVLQCKQRWNALRVNFRPFLFRGTNGAGRYILRNNGYARLIPRNFRLRGRGVRGPRASVFRAASLDQTLDSIRAMKNPRCK